MPAHRRLDWFHSYPPLTTSLTSRASDSRRGRWGVGCAALALWLCLSAASSAQLPLAHLSRIFPCGGAQGATCEVTISGADLEDVDQLIFNHRGIKAERMTQPAGEFDRGPTVQPGRFSVAIDKEVPPGVYEVRAFGRYGISNPRVFIVSADQEWVDLGSNQSREQAASLSVGSTANGWVEARSSDYFQIELSQGQRVLIDGAAQRIDSRLDPMLVLSNAAGRELARSSDSIGRDAVLDFVAPETGAYVVAIHDTVFRGGSEYFYRLRIHQQPHIDFVFPPVAPLGAESTITLFGRNLPDGKLTNDVRLRNLALDALEVKVTVPFRESDATRFAPQLRPLTTAFTETRWVDTPVGPVELAVPLAPLRIESPGNDHESPEVIPVPCDVSGQFYPRRDQDWYEFTASRSQRLRIEIYSHRLGTAADPLLLVQRVNRADNGSETTQDLTTLDDPRERNGQIGSDFDTSTDDPEYVLDAQQGTTYRIMVRDQFGSSIDDPRRVYRLVIRPESPGYDLLAAPLQIKVANNNQVLSYSLGLRRGETIPIKVIVQRRDGFREPIEIRMDGLPEGVLCQPVVVPPEATEAWLALECAVNAPRGVSAATLTGTAVWQDRLLRRTAKVATVVWPTANRTQSPPSFRLTGNLYVAVSDQPPVLPAQLSIASNRWSTSKGGTIEIPVELRREAGFKEAVKLVATGLPNELKPADVTIAADQSAATLRLTATNPKLTPGWYAFYLRADTKTQLTRTPTAINETASDLSHVQDLLATLANSIQEREAQLTTARQTLMRLTESEKQSEQQRTVLTAKLQMASKQRDDLSESLQSAQAASAAAPQDEPLQRKVTMISQQHQQAAEQVSKLQQQATAMSEQLGKTKADLAESQRAVQAAQRELAALKEQQQRATAHQSKVKASLEALKKTYAAKDYNFALVSAPISVEVRTSPIELTAFAERVYPNDQGIVSVQVRRRDGFEGPIEVQVQPPEKSQGVTFQPLTLDANSSEGQLTFKTGADTAPGEYPLIVVAKAKFNNVDVRAEARAVLEIK